MNCRVVRQSLYQYLKVTKACSDRKSLQPSAVEIHSDLAHFVVQYLGASSPSDLSVYNIHSPGDLVDVISRVCSYLLSKASIECHFPVRLEHVYGYGSFSNANWSVYFSSCGSIQSLLRAQCRCCFSSCLLKQQIRTFHASCGTKRFMQGRRSEFIHTSTSHQLAHLFHRY